MIDFYEGGFEIQESFLLQNPISNFIFLLFVYTSEDFKKRDYESGRGVFSYWLEWMAHNLAFDGSLPFVIFGTLLSNGQQLMPHFYRAFNSGRSAFFDDDKDWFEKAWKRLFGKKE